MDISKQAFTQAVRAFYAITSLSGILTLLGILALFMLYWAGDSAVARIRSPFPQSPWESQIMVDAMLLSSNSKIYTDPYSATGHATHMYGPLISYTVGAINKCIGYDLRIGRWIACAAALIVAVGMAIKLSPRWWMFPLVFALVFYQFYRGRAYFAETRPDCISILFSALSLWLFFLAFTRDLRWLTPALAAMLVGFLFKQTAAAVAMVPFTAILFSPPPQMEQENIISRCHSCPYPLTYRSAYPPDRTERLLSHVCHCFSL